VFVTTFCNFRCGFCEFAADTLPREQKIHFPFELWEPLLVDLRAEGCQEIYLTGGEPLMHPRFWDMVRQAQRLDLPVHRITTNGSLAKQMTDADIALARDAVRAIQVSVDSPIAEEHDRIRGFEGAFARLEEFINLMISHEVPTHISNVLTEETFPRASDLIAWASSMRVSHVNFQPCNWEANYGDYRAVEDKARFRVPRDQIRSLEKSLAEADWTARQLSITTNLPILRRWVRAFFECQGAKGEFFHDRLFRHFRCYIPHTTVYIGSNGEIFPCTLLPRVGQLGEADFRTLWRANMQRVRRHLDQGKFFPVCNSCYCDFPSNLRVNLTRHPLENMGLALKTLAYYTSRLQTY
jgi:MoaA/NifB/PqqE/SkfB family radical SAM enzyme